MLSLVFYLVAAHAFTVGGFGVVRYTLTLALLALSPVLVLSRATTRELGAARGVEAKTRTVLGTTLTLSAWIWVATGLLCVAASAAGLTGSADLVGLLVALAGLAIFNLYYQISRGLGLIRRIAYTYVGASVLQLVVLTALVTVTDVSPTVALIVFGAGYVVAIATCEAVTPVVRGRLASFSRETGVELWRFMVPLLLSQAGFIIWFSADQIWVDTTLGVTQVGLYGAAKTLIQAFFVLIAGSNGVVMPRVAELRAAGKNERARRFILVMVLRLSGLAIVAAAVIIAARSPLLSILFGSSYEAAATALVALTLGMAVYATFVAITMSCIGWGRPGVSALGYGVASISEVALLLFAGGSSIAFAGWMNAASIGLGLVAIAITLVVRPLR